MSLRRTASLLLLAGLSGLIPAVGQAAPPQDATPQASAPQKEVTYTKDVAPILFKNCAVCHRPNDMAPMSLMTYKDVQPYARQIREKVVQRVMPPWHADPKVGEFSNDLAPQ